MAFFDFPALLLGVLSGILLWGLDMTFGPATSAVPLVAGWATLVCLAGVAYDRLDPDEGLRGYYLWVNSTFSESGEPSRSRVAVLGVPLVVWPAAMAVFGLAFPLISGDELPPIWFFGVGALTPVALLVQHARSR